MVGGGWWRAGLKITFGCFGVSLLNRKKPEKERKKNEKRMKETGRSRVAWLHLMVAALRNRLLVLIFEGTFDTRPSLTTFPLSGNLRTRSLEHTASPYTSLHYGAYFLAVMTDFLAHE